MKPRPDEDDDADLVPGMPFHHHRPPRWIIRAVIGLLVLAGMNLAGLTVSLYQDFVQQEYIEGKGEQRDRERNALEKLMRELDREAACELLDQLPADNPFLERSRRKYGCGPGIPAENLTPEEQAQLNGRAQPRIPEPTKEPTRPVPPTGSSAVPAPTGTPPASVPGPASPQPGQAPEPQPEPASPILDLGGATGQICDTLRICL